MNFCARVHRPVLHGDDVLSHQTIAPLDVLKANVANAPLAFKNVQGRHAVSVCKRSAVQTGVGGHAGQVRVLLEKALFDGWG